MKKRALALAGLLALAPIAEAQPQPEKTLSLEGFTKQLEDSQLNGPLAERLREFQALARPEVADYPVAALPGATAGATLKFDAQGRLVVVRGPTAKPNDILITQDAVSDIGTMTPARFRDLIAGVGRSGPAEVLARLNEAARTVDPIATDYNVQNLPKEWRPRASAVGWSGASGNFSTTCQASRNAFADKAEQALLSDEVDPTDARPEPERGDFIRVINAFDKDCLTAIAPGNLAVGGPPLRAIAVIGGPRGPHCMATHLGGVRFLTARHCFFQANGADLEGQAAFTVSMIDGSAVDVPVRVATAQPVASLAVATSPRDMLIVEAVALPPSVAAAEGPTLLPSKDLAGVMVSEAYVLGYFPLANPERVIRASGGPPGSLPAWNEALRATTKVGLGYCRVWDYTPPAADGTACLQHSCQTVKGFSGAPVFVRKDDNTWVLAGVHVANGDKATQGNCGQFKGASQGGLLGLQGGIAAALPQSMILASVAPGRGAGLGK